MLTSTDRKRLPLGQLSGSGGLGTLPRRADIGGHRLRRQIFSKLDVVASLDHSHRRGLQPARQPSINNTWLSDRQLYAEVASQEFEAMSHDIIIAPRQR